MRWGRRELCGAVCAGPGAAPAGKIGWDPPRKIMKAKRREKNPPPTGKPARGFPAPAPAPRPNMPTAPKKYWLRARGWAVEVTAHRLSAKQLATVREHCAREGIDSESLGNMEEILPDYNCYDTNMWQSGCVPVADLTGFSLVDGSGKELFAIPPLSGTRVEGESSGEKKKSARGNVLVYFEESKGLVATWELESSSAPVPGDFSFRISRILVGPDATEYVDGVIFRGEELERDYDGEELVGKAAYSRLL